MSGIEYWTNQPDLLLFKEKDPNHPDWCKESERFAQWGETLVVRVAEDPTPGKIAFAQHKLLHHYARRYHSAPADHRAETNLDNHPCLHQVLISVADKLEDLELAAGIPELSLPVPARSEPPPPPRVIEGEVVHRPGPPVEEEFGINLGEAEDEGGPGPA